jgi:hypothetical protein
MPEFPPVTSKFTSNLPSWRIRVSNFGRLTNGNQSNFDCRDTDRTSYGDHRSNCRSSVCATGSQSYWWYGARRARSACWCRTYNYRDWCWRLLALQTFPQDKLTFPVLSELAKLGFVNEPGAPFFGGPQMVTNDRTSYGDSACD